MEGMRESLCDHTVNAMSTGVEDCRAGLSAPDLAESRSYSYTGVGNMETRQDNYSSAGVQ